MKRGIKFGIFVLVAILSVYFVLAASWNLAPSTTSADSTIKMIAFNVSNGTTDTNFTNVTIALLGNASVGNITNVTISNVTKTFFNITNGGFNSSGLTTIHLNVPGNNSQGGTNWTINFTLSSSATFGFTVGAQVKGIGNRTIDNLTYSILPYTSNNVTITESTNPVASASCSRTSLYEGSEFPCTCSGTDSGATASGVASSTGTSDSSDGTATPTTAGTFTYTCTVTDNAGNSDTDTIEYRVIAMGGGYAGTPSSPKDSYSWSKITPGAAAIVKDSNAETGVTQIQITVNNEAQSVQITVTKYDSKPANVSVSKTGKVYRYLQINAQNLGNKLDEANVRFRVEKTWLASNSLDKNNIAIYKFDAATSKWNEQTTTYNGEDADYHYYDLSLDSFSYFAISEKNLVAGEGTTATGEEPAEEGGSMVWLWVLIIAIVVFFVWKAMSRKKR